MGGDSTTRVRLSLGMQGFASQIEMQHMCTYNETKIERIEKRPHWNQAAVCGRPTKNLSLQEMRQLTKAQSCPTMPRNAKWQRQLGPNGKRTLPRKKLELP